MNKEEKKKLLEKTILDHQTMLYRISVFHRERGTGGAGCRPGNDRQGVFADWPAPAAGIYPDVVSADLYQ